MRRPIARGLVLVLGLSLGACFGESEPAVRVLFIGNSHTFSNDMPGMVRQLAGSVGSNVEVGMQAPAGWWWRDHAASKETSDAIADGDWDFVVLQEQSMAPADQDIARKVSYPAAEALSRSVIGNGGDVVFFLTWAHRSGSPQLGHVTYSSMQIDVANSYQAFSEAIISEIAPVGMAWWMALAERKDIEMYQPDGVHPSLAGSYLAAAVITSTILDVDPTSFEEPLDLAEGTAEALRSFAARAVAGEVPWEN